MGSDLTGEGFLSDPLTGPSEKPKRGRPEAISDAELRAAYADLIFALSECWAAVGWELRNATEISQIHQAFGNITGINCSRLNVFVREHASPGTAQQIAKSRAELREMSKEIFKSHQRRRECEKTLDQSERAMHGSQNAVRAEELRLLANAWGRKLEDAKALLATQTEQFETLNGLVERQEAFVAQDQLLKFILSNRRRLTPRAFAAAMAGLPFIAWRQSSERCADFWKSYPETSSYSLFLVVAEICARAPRSSGLLVEKARGYISAPNRKDEAAYQSLRDHWYFLESAITSVFAECIPSADALPYRIVAEYQKLCQCPSTRDVLLNQEYRL